MKSLLTIVKSKKVYLPILGAVLTAAVVVVLAAKKPEIEAAIEDSTED